MWIWTGGLILGSAPASRSGRIFALGELGAWAYVRAARA